MKSIDIKTTNVNKFNKKIKKNKFLKFPIFSVIEFNLHGSCNRRCAFCPRVDENLWPNIDEEFSFELFRKIIKELSQVNYSGRMTFSGFSEPTLHSQLPKLLMLIKNELPSAYPELLQMGII